MPKANSSFWEKKIHNTRVRDNNAEAELANRGWKVLKVWECAIRGRARLKLSDLVEEVVTWLADGGTGHEIKGTWEEKP